jgi:hypothetical protein
MRYKEHCPDYDPAEAGLGSEALLGLGCSCQLYPPNVSAKPTAWKLQSW